MFEFPSEDRPTTVGVAGPPPVLRALRAAKSDIDADASLRRLDDADDGVSEQVDCVVAASGNGGSAPSDATEWAAEVADGETAPPVLLLASPEAPATEAIRCDGVEYLPLSAVEQAPATVLRRAVDTVPTFGAADYRTIYDNVSEPLTLHDPETGELVHANRRMCELLGYDRADLVAMQVGEYTADIEGYDQAAAMEITTSVTEGGTVGPVEWPLETASGEQVWVEATLTAVEVGGRELVLATATDVTDRRRQRRQLQEITEHIDEVVYLARADLSEVLFVNDAYAELFGQPVERVYEDPLAVLDAVHPEDREAYRADLAAMSDHVRAGEDDPYEFSHRLRVAGETRWVEVTGYPSRGPGGDVDRIVGVIRDVTERERRQREYEEIFDGVNNAIVVHDPETGEIVDVNATLCELTGYDREVILREGMSRLNVHEEGYTDERARDLVTSVTESESDETVEWRIETADGERRTIESNLTVATVGGHRRVLSLIRDVTERRRRQREYEQIFHGTNDAIAVFDAETGEIVDVNDPYRDLVGYDDLDRIRELGIDGLSATDEGYTAQRGQELIQEVARTGDPQTVEWRAQRRDGQRLWLEATLATAEIGGEQRVLSIQRDITERVRREREYKEVFDGVTDAIAVHDPETGEMVDVNATLCELTGYDREAILNRGPEQILVDHAEADVPPTAVPAIIDRVMDGEVVDPYEQVIETADGDHVWIEVNPTRAVIGGEERFLAISRDITERVRREREFEQIFHGVTDVIGIYDPETAELLDVNDTMCELLGYDRETILDMEPEAVTATELGFDVETVAEVVREVAETGEPARDIEWALRAASGETLWLEVNATLAEIGGERRVLTIARDVTGRRDREERVQVLNRVLRHNLRNDVDPLRAHATAIEERADRERVRDHAGQIRETVDELLDLSGKARTAERILRGDGDGNPETQAAGTVVESVVSDVRTAHTDATFDVLSAASDTRVEADFFRLVVHELVENAAEHGGDSPAVTVRTARVDGGLTVTVADDGPGIPDRVLAPFQGGGESQLRHNHGLGLWLVNWGVRRLGGGIEFERPADGGTVARLRLPGRGD